MSDEKTFQVTIKTDGWTDTVHSRARNAMDAVDATVALLRALDKVEHQNLSIEVTEVDTTLDVLLDRDTEAMEPDELADWIEAVDKATHEKLSQPGVMETKLAEIKRRTRADPQE